MRPAISLCTILAAWILVLAGVRPAGAQDRLVLTSGLELTGEIQSGSRGEIRFDHDELDVVTVDVDDIAVLLSPRFFEIRDESGRVFRGSLQAADPGQVRVAGAEGSEPLRIGDIVEVLVFDDGLLARTNGFLDIGVNVARANALSSLSLGSLFNYRGPAWGWSARLEAYWQTQTTVAPDGTEFDNAARRSTFRAAVSRFLGRWTIQGSGTWDKNDELDLESRVQVGGQGIYTFVENATLDFSAGGGLVSNTEQYVGQDVNNTAEVVVGVGLDVFDLGDVNIYWLVESYTSLNQDRIRLRADGRIAWEFIDDFSLNFSVNENLDSRPPVEGSSKRDYRYGFSVGWSWN